MRSKKILGLILAASLLTTGCSVKFGTNSDDSKAAADDITSTYEQAITSMAHANDKILATPKGEGIDNKESLEITYLDFKKEYLYWMQANEITDDSDELYAESCASQRFSIITYLVNEAILGAKAKQLGLDQFTPEELDKLEADYQARIEDQVEYFGNNADYGTLEEGQTISDEEKRARGEADFDRYLANALLTRDDLLAWQRASLLAEKVTAEVTKDVTVDRSEAEKVYNDYIESVKKLYNEDPAAYETGGQYTSFWVPEGTRNIKHILIALDEKDSDEIAAMRQNGDTEGADALRAEKLAAKETEAVEIKNMLDNGADFDELIKEYSADAAGSMMYPDGYVVIPGSTMFVSDFVEAAFSIQNIGEYVMAPSDYGWHIVMYSSDTVISDEDRTDYIDYIQNTLLEQAKSEKFTETMKQWHEEFLFEVDYDALNIVVEDPTAEAADSAVN